MAGETFVGDPSDIHMGPAALYYNGRCLGYTLNDSVKINVTMTPTPITPDQSSLPIKDIITEMAASVDATLAEVNADNLNMIPGVTNGSFADPIGIDMKSIARLWSSFRWTQATTTSTRFRASAPRWLMAFRL